jgi:Mlc titration factor MtfA (ptsG expression regulator)
VPPHWHRIVARNVPIARELTRADRDRLLKLTQQLLRDVPFEGCAGMEITDEVRVTIGANACVLLLGLSHTRFLDVRRILVYPSTFVPRRVQHLHAEFEEEDDEPTLGEAWGDGIIVLSWDEVRDDAEHPGDGRNVVIHEFAHVLDQEDGYSDGTPILDGSAGTWGQVLEREFRRQREAVEADQEAPLDDYAATDRAEFFAVATEAFFEIPEYVRDEIPELYALMRQYYGQDPADPERRFVPGR